MRYVNAIATASEVLGILLALSACGARVDSGGTGSNTHFLQDCRTDADCGGSGLQCLCDICTLTCETQSECAGHGRRAECESVQGLGQECSLAAALVCQAAPATTPPVDASDVQTRDAGESTVIPMTSTESGRDGGAPRHDPDESSATPLTSTEGSRDAAPPGQDAGPIAFEFTRCATPTDLPASECATDLCFPEAFYWNATTDDRENGLRCHQDDCGRSDVYQAFAYGDDHVFL